MARERTGGVKYLKGKGAWQARITYFDELGKRRDLRRQAETKTEAKNILKKLKRDLDDHGPAIIDADRLTFKKLAAVYEERRLTPPVYKGDTKISGLRSYKLQRHYLKTLAEHFGARRVKSITYCGL